MFRQMFHAKYMATGVRLFSTISPHNHPISTIIKSHTNCGECVHYNEKNGKCHRFIDTKNNGKYIEAQIARERADLCGPNGNAFENNNNCCDNNIYFYGTLICLTFIVLRL